MENNNILMFIGDMISSQEIRITRKPSIYDAFLLTEKSISSFPAPMDGHYQSIPLEEQATILIHINQYHILLSYQQNSLHIAESGKNFPEEEVLEVFSNFIVRIGGKITYLGTSPYCKKRPRRKKKERIVAEEKKLEISRF
ncbi:hypothetical protein V7266_18545 [Neobacillus drentensis]|uniref:hypothetical protein n=1 Tax=Neobacillus drentensis TaxID=220684 RepID=UPI003000A611